LATTVRVGTLRARSESDEKGAHMPANEVLKTLENDGLALTQARWSFVGTDPDGGRVEMDGEGTVVSRRQPDGSWRIVMENPIRPVTSSRGRAGSA
jgi:ketosteroid isomerase-like protein